MSDKIVPTVELVPIVGTDGVHISLYVPTYDGDKLFTLTCERDGDNDWRIEFSAPEDHESENVRVGAAAGMYYLGSTENKT